MSEDDQRGAIEADLRRVADRLRGAPELRVEAAAASARAVLQLLADTALGADTRRAEQPPAWREVPTLPLGALGDQLAVLGQDLLTAVREVPGEDEVWTREGREPLAIGLTTLVDQLRALRMSL